MNWRIVCGMGVPPAPDLRQHGQDARATTGKHAKPLPSASRTSELEVVLNKGWKNGGEFFRMLER
jgi:hypothetical protein